MSLLRVEGLEMSFGEVQALRGVNFSVERGEILGLLGPNGAGKSTSIRIVVGYLPPRAGRVLIDGVDAAISPREAKRRIGYLPEGAPLYADSTPEGLLSFVGRLHGLNGSVLQKRIEAVVREMGLREVSKGFRRRLGIAQAMIHDPDILILDEPTDGLDPNQKHAVRSLLTQAKANKAVVVSTHLLEEVDMICDRVVVIDRGAVLGVWTPAELRALAENHNAIVLSVAAPDATQAHSLLAAMEGVERVERQGDGTSVRLTAFPQGGAFLADKAADLLRREAISFRDFHTQEGRLDLVFRQLTSHRRAV